MRKIFSLETLVSTDEHKTDLEPCYVGQCKGSICILFKDHENSRKLVTIQSLSRTMMMTVNIMSFWQETVVVAKHPMCLLSCRSVLGFSRETEQT